jgi:hypothetical protein
MAYIWFEKCLIRLSSSSSSSGGSGDNGGSGNCGLQALICGSGTPITQIFLPYNLAYYIPNLTPIPITLKSFDSSRKCFLDLIFFYLASLTRMFKFLVDRFSTLAVS